MKIKYNYKRTTYGDVLDSNGRHWQLEKTGGVWQLRSMDFAGKNFQEIAIPGSYNKEEAIKILVK